MMICRRPLSISKRKPQVKAGVCLMRKYVSSTPLVKTLLSDFRQLYFEKVGPLPLSRTRSLTPTPAG